MKKGLNTKNKQFGFKDISSNSWWAHIKTCLITNTENQNPTF